MPELRRTDFGDVSAHRTGNGIVVCCGVSGVRNHASDGKVAIFHVPDHRFNHHGFAVRLLPDLVTWPGFAAGLVLSAFVPPSGGFGQALSWRLLHQRLQPNAAGLVDAILGAAFGSFLLWGLAAGYKLVRKREGMGLGDVKMMAMVGAFVGLRGTFWTILLGSLLGSVVGVSVVVALYLGGWRRGLAERGSRRGLGTVSALRWTIASQYQLPLGTFLGIGALAIVYLGPLMGSGWPSLRGVFE